MGMTDEDYRATTQLARKLSDVIALAGELAKRVAYLESQVSTLRQHGVRLSEWRRIHDEIDAIEEAGLMEEALKMADEALAEEEERRMN